MSALGKKYILCIGSFIFPLLGLALSPAAFHSFRCRFMGRLSLADGQRANLKSMHFGSLWFILSSAVLDSWSRQGEWRGMTLSNNVRESAEAIIATGRASSARHRLQL